MLIFLEGYMKPIGILPIRFPIFNKTSNTPSFDLKIIYDLFRF